MWWFEKTKHITSNAVVSAPDKNVTIAKKCSVFPVEFVGKFFDFTPLARCYFPFEVENVSILCLVRSKESVLSCSDLLVISGAMIKIYLYFSQVFTYFTLLVIPVHGCHYLNLLNIIDGNSSIQSICVCNVQLAVFNTNISCL